MVDIEELPEEEPTPTTPPTTTTTKDEDGWEELMGKDLVMKVNATWFFLEDAAAAAAVEVG